jgi:hypothetical protein
MGLSTHSILGLINILEYLLKARTVEPEKLPLFLDNSSVNTFRRQQMSMQQ